MTSELREESTLGVSECDKSRSEIIKLISELIVENKVAFLTSCGADQHTRSCPMLNIN